MEPKEDPFAANASTSAELRATDIGVTVMAVVFVALRFFARKQRAAGTWWDDWMMLVTLLLHFANLALNLMMIDNGLGIQAAVLPVENVIMIAKLLFADEAVYLLVLTLVKIAILLMYCRIFPLRGIKIGSWILCTLTVLWCLAFVFVCIFQCNPIPRAWDPTVPGTCVNLRKLFIGNAIPNILTDAAILTMPIQQVWKLQARLAQKITISGIFLLGCFVIFASIYRLITVLKLDQNNLSYTLAKPTTWSHIEVCAAIVSACLPTLRPLVMLCIHSLGGTEHRSTTKYPSGKPAGEGFRGKLRETLVTIAGEETEFDGKDGTDCKSNEQQHGFQNLEDPSDLRSWPSSAKKNGSEDGMSTDEVPLTQIKVRTDLAVGECQRNEVDDEADMERKYGAKRW